MRTWNGAWTKGTGAGQKAQFPVNPGCAALTFLNSKAAPGVVTPRVLCGPAGVCEDEDEDALEERIAQAVPNESFRDESKAKVGREEEQEAGNEPEGPPGHKQVTHPLLFAEDLIS